ncbi:hypothetical protein BpHYR1_050765 [Brachionus plicatilis]|uniref:Uncharacterized protein n=1 Tax=Brachionus plicatilis TaxID=10195 RepID=A0A3M7P9J4_BRAPC|nr:hypothetical protein BpHYR1_050765 [Brachionus plicatilis]
MLKRPISSASSYNVEYANCFKSPIFIIIIKHYLKKELLNKFDLDDALNELMEGQFLPIYSALVSYFK